ncbi:putative non-LTR retroelement reverse transcriptase [Cucumis melo var. makuwa]|uniref:Non-LTR retroelement reverse transcriptase n=1 Tax=Cucumis melo var. makuwa TaxID=1194695 RepID=A0A5D3BGD0_CUCMM|nr:putative non-LTR retroelement reverse transcriptase [Cucumis melo var. makuwa]TYJ98177.1 putative non-LTR retroelement reverse transcriptase [Cucumis melo var. makuwa]
MHFEALGSSPVPIEMEEFNHVILEVEAPFRYVVLLVRVRQQGVSPFVSPMHNLHDLKPVLRRHFDRHIQQLRRSRQASLATEAFWATARLEEVSLRQKSCIRWLDFKDQNSTFFHCSILSRVVVNCFRNSLSSHVIGYRELSPMLKDIIQFRWKTPGRDAFSMGFLKSAWNVVREDFCDVVLHFFEFFYLPHSVNAIVITLILKHCSGLVANLMIFCAAVESLLGFVRETLLKFWELSGLVANLGKSSMFVARVDSYGLLIVSLLSSVLLVGFVVGLLEFCLLLGEVYLPLAIRDGLSWNICEYLEDFVVVVGSFEFFAIFQQSDRLKKHVCLEVGDGRLCRVWLDLWVQGGPILEQVGEVSMELLDLWERVQVFHSYISVEDQWVWVLGSQGRFSIAIVWEAICPGSLGGSVVGWREYSQVVLV